MGMLTMFEFRSTKKVVFLRSDGVLLPIAVQKVALLISGEGLAYASALNSYREVILRKK